MSACVCVCVLNGWIQLYAVLGSLTCQLKEEISWEDGLINTALVSIFTESQKKAKNKNRFHSSASVTYQWAFFTLIIFLLPPQAQHWSHKWLTTWLCVNISKPHSAVLKCTWSFLMWKRRQGSMGWERTTGGKYFREMYNFTSVWPTSDSCVTCDS